MSSTIPTSIEIMSVSIDLSDIVIKSFFDTIGLVQTFNLTAHHHYYTGTVIYDDIKLTIKAYHILNGIYIKGHSMYLKLIYDQLDNTKQKVNKLIFKDRFYTYKRRHHYKLSNNMSYKRRRLINSNSSLISLNNQLDKSELPNLNIKDPYKFNFTPTDPLLSSLNNININDASLALNQLRHLAINNTSKAMELLDHFPQLAVSIVLILQFNKSLPTKLPMEAFREDTELIDLNNHETSDNNPLDIPINNKPLFEQGILDSVHYNTSTL